MRRVAVAAASLLFFAALFFASFIVVGETGEVIVLYSSDRGEWAETRLWVVDDGGALWIRSGSPDRGWARRATAEPAVELERSGERRPYAATAIRTAEARERVDRLMREKYGLADRWATAFRPDEPITFRLDPVGTR